jgi:hypothetical protein
MSQTTVVTQDSFEKARMAFFGNVIATSSQNAMEAGAMVPRNEPARETAAQMTQTKAAS